MYSTTVTLLRYIQEPCDDADVVETSRWDEKGTLFIRTSAQMVSTLVFFLQITEDKMHKLQMCVVNVII